MTEAAHVPFQFFETPCEAWDAIYADCAKATSSILCEHYILEDDSVGHRFLDLFTAKAKDGIKVLLILDGIGSRQLISSAKITALQEAGGIVHFYKPPTWRLIIRPWRWLPRNHNKIILVDEHIGHIGSACIKQDMCEWRDIHVRFEGFLARSLHNKILNMDAYLAGRTADITLQGHNPPSDIQADISYAISQPYFGRNPIYRALLTHIRHARHRILLVTPYFLPPRKLRKALIRAAKRGVKVTLMLSEQTDVPAADCVSRSYFPRLLRKGITIALFRKTVLHAKYVVIDDNYAMVGSTNLDYLSLRKNHETNMIIHDPHIVGTLAAQFAKDQADCHVADWNYWHQLPLYYRFIGYIGRFAKKVM